MAKKHAPPTESAVHGASVTPGADPARRSEETETMIRAAVVAYVAKEGHGAATRLGALIGRPASWIGQFVRRERRATIDDAVQMANALDLSLRARPATQARAAEPVDPVTLKGEAHWLRLYRRLDPETRPVAVEVVTALARKRASSRISRSTTAKSSAGKDRSRATDAARAS